jgi:hypothetical protein
MLLRAHVRGQLAQGGVAARFRFLQHLVQALRIAHQVAQRVLDAELAFHLQLELPHQVGKLDISGLPRIVLVGHCLEFPNIGVV